jgi:hypothetical protein
MIALMLAALLLAPLAPPSPRAVPAPAPMAVAVAPAEPATAPPAEPSPLPPEVRELVELARALHESLGAPPPPGPVVDGPGTLPEWAELALPAAMAHLREVRSETTLTVPRPTTLDVSTFAGMITVQAWNRNEVRVIARHGRRDRLQPRLVNGTLTVVVVDRTGEPAFGDVTVLVPEWMPMRLSSVESPIDVEGVRAAIEAGSIRGDVVVHQVVGALQLRSVEGLVRVLDARGPVQVASINNLVVLERITGGIDAESVNGDIQMSDVDSHDVDASSVNCNVQFLGPFQPRGRYRLASHNGNLRVGVPVGADVDVSVHNFRGAFRNGLLPPVGPHGAGNRFTFTLGGGGSSLELQSFQGFIQLLRSNEMPAQAPPAAPRPPSVPQPEGR